MNLIKLMSNKNFGVYNKDLAQRLGLIESIIFGELCSEYDYYHDNDMLYEDEWFYSTTENLEKNLNLGYKTQSKAIKKLIEIGLISQKNVGIPMKRYFKINQEKLLELVELELPNGKTKNCPKGKTSIAQKEKLELPNGQTNNNKEQYSYNNNNQHHQQNNNSFTDDDDIEGQAFKNSETPKESLIDFIENNMHPLTPVEMEEVCQWDDNDLTRYAIKQAVLRGARTIRYIDRVLYNYKKQGITTVQQAIEEENKYQRQKEDYNKAKSEYYQDKYRDLTEEEIDKAIDDAYNEIYGGKNGKE